MELLFNAVSAVPRPALLAALAVLAVIVWMRRRNRAHYGDPARETPQPGVKIYRTSRGRRTG